MLEYKEGISKATIARLPIYLRFLRDRQAAGERYASSTQIADRMRLNPVQVRKDLALVSSESGRPKLGFRIDELIEDIERFLGCDNVNDALIVGVGGLGRTLLSYEGFRNYGLNIVAASIVAGDRRPHVRRADSAAGRRAGADGGGEKRQNGHHYGT